MFFDAEFARRQFADVVLDIAFAAASAQQPVTLNGREKAKGTGFGRFQGGAALVVGYRKELIHAASIAVRERLRAIQKLEAALGGR